MSHDNGYFIKPKDNPSESLGDPKVKMIEIQPSLADKLDLVDQNRPHKIINPMNITFRNPKSFAIKLM